MRCFVEPARWQAGDDIELEGEEAHHLRTVVRGRVGQRVDLFDGRGHTAEAEIVAMDRHRACVRMVQQAAQPRAALETILILGVPREQKMDLVVQKATELGVTRILPVRADHAVMQVRSDNEDSKRDRWQRIALNAAKQCGTAWLPDIGPAQVLEDVLAGLPAATPSLLCSLDPDAAPLRPTLASLRALAPRAMAVLVGPEGDFSARERAVARNAGARPVHLGSLTLRSETAALYVLSVLKYEFGA
jgi:16S rRNA (uracil1498-N3)-methyltransferase